MNTSPKQFWRRRVAQTAFRYNLGRVLDVFLALGGGWSVLFTCTLLILRRDDAFTPTVWAWYGAGLLAGAAAAWAWQRRAFFSVDDARVRLEWHLRLHNRLTAASAGVGAFPPIQDAPDGLVFRWERIAAVLGGSAALVLAAALVPISPARPSSPPTMPPMAWTQAAAWAEALKKSETVQDAALEALRERVDELRRQPADEWYSHSSLEAGDNLRDQTARSIAGLERDLQSAGGALTAAEHFDDTTSALEKKMARETLANALKGLEMGTLPLNRELLGQLKDANLAGLKSLSAGQMAELKKRLAEGTKVCKACLGTGPGKPGDDVLVLAQAAVPGGKGGGKQSAPLNLNQKPTDLATKTTATVSNPDLSRALPGDVLGVNKGEHPVDRNQFAGTADGGAISSVGQGGEAVWRNDLTPDEREVLKRFFK